MTLLAVRPKPKAKSADKLLTAEEFFEFVHRPENAERFFELDHGKVEEMPVPKKYHGFVCANIAFIFTLFARNRKRGYVCTNDSGFIVERDPDTVRGPDVSFYEDDQTAADMDRLYTHNFPRVAIDVLSPDDSIGRVMRRIRHMIDCGVPLIWLVDPEARNVLVLRPGKEDYLVEENEIITGEDVLPDFKCRVAEFFKLPGQESKAKPSGKRNPKK